jgi:hypothetical protein
MLHMPNSFHIAHLSILSVILNWNLVILERNKNIIAVLNYIRSSSFTESFYKVYLINLVDSLVVRSNYMKKEKKKKKKICLAIWRVSGYIIQFMT